MSKARASAFGKLHPMSPNRTVTVYGAYGHTGRFVVAELLSRGWIPILAGRSTDRIEALTVEHPELKARPAEVESPDELDDALAGAAAIVNCAGPFAATAAPMIDAALRARIPYLDVAAEIEANIDTFAIYGDRVREAGLVVIPAMAFFGGLGDLLATAAMGDWPAGRRRGQHRLRAEQLGADGRDAGLRPGIERAARRKAGHLHERQDAVPHR